MKDSLGVSPSKGNQGTTRGKEKIFWPRWVRFPLRSKDFFFTSCELHSSGIVVWCLRPFLVYISLNKNITIVIYLVLQSTPTHVNKRAWYSTIAPSPLFVDFDLTTKRSLAKNVCICLNHQELRSWLVFLSAGLRRWNYEVLFYVYRHGTHDPMMCLIFLILIIWADNNKVYNYRLHFSWFPPLTDFALRRNRANTALDSFVLEVRLNIR